MGTFNEFFDIAAASDGPFETIEAMVDTGATYTWVPASILRRLGVEAIDSETFILADGSSIERPVGEAVVRLDGRVRTTLVVFADDDTGALLGAYTLEAFTLAVDPSNGRLTRIQGHLGGWIGGNGR